MSRNCHYTGCILCQCQIEGMIPKVICKKQTMQLPHTARGTSRRSILTDPLFRHIARIFEGISDTIYTEEDTIKSCVLCILM